MENLYDGYNIEPMPTWSGAGSDPTLWYADTRAYNAMRDLGFHKVASHCVYTGDVNTLVNKLKEMGWKPLPHKSNPFLLQHDETSMVFNYALTDKIPSHKYVSYFRGS